MSTQPAVPDHDLAVVVGLVGLAVLALLPGGVPTYVEWLVGVPFLLVLPGYALTAALLPGSGGDPSGVDPGWPVRVALSLALSVLVVGVVGVVLGVTWGLRLGPAVAAVGAATVGGALLAHLRRRRLPPRERAPTLAGGVGSLRGSIDASPPSIALAVALCTLAVAVALAGVAPADSQPYSEFYVLAEDGDGDLVAADYPRTFVVGQADEVHLAIENHERRPVTYDVVVLARSAGSSPDREVVDRFEVRLEDGERTVRERSIRRAVAGPDTRLDFLLYKDDAPTDPDPGSADLALHLWVDVVEAGQSPAVPRRADGIGSRAGSEPADAVASR